MVLTRCWVRRSSIVMLTLVSSIGIGAIPAHAGGYKAVYRFGPPPAAGGPNGSLVEDSAGRFYGTLAIGGANGMGSVFRLDPPVTPGGQWTEEILHDFTGSDGANPTGLLTIGPSGELYGVAGGGPGPYLGGTVFRLDENSGGWSLTTLHNFLDSASGSAPMGGLVFGPGGLLYGVAASGGAYDSGTVFEISPLGDTTAFAVIDNIGSRDGASGLFDALLPVKDGFIGTTYRGNTGGTVFKLTLGASGQWIENIIHEFGGTGDFSAPLGSLVRGADGSFYGCAGGNLNGLGPMAKGGVYALKHDGGGVGWVETILYTFGAATGEPDPTGTSCGVTLNHAVQILGTAAGGGDNGTGAFFQLTPPPTVGQAWAETVLHSFAFGSPQGAYPIGAPVRSGATYVGATIQTSAPITSYGGTVYKLTAPAP